MVCNKDCPHKYEFCAHRYLDMIPAMLSDMASEWGLEVWHQYHYGIHPDDVDDSDYHQSYMLSHYGSISAIGGHYRP